MAKYKVSEEVIHHLKWGGYKIVKVVNAHNITIRFENTGYETVVEHSALHTNAVRDYEAPSVFGVGIIGADGKGCYKDNESAKRCWSDMLRRCYDTKYKAYSSYGAVGVSVCESWFRFTNFLRW